jgi:pantothenate synthetase
MRLLALIKEKYLFLLNNVGYPPCIEIKQYSSHMSHSQVFSEVFKGPKKSTGRCQLPGFTVGEDFGSYPSNFEGDLLKLRALSVDAVFNPHDLYVRGDGKTFGEEGNGTQRIVSCLEEGGANGHETWIRVERLEKPLCGVSRPVYFRGEH